MALIASSDDRSFGCVVIVILGRHVVPNLQISTGRPASLPLVFSTYEMNHRVIELVSRLMLLVSMLLVITSSTGQLLSPNLQDHLVGISRTEP
jgi:hypothetical protein